MTRWCFAAHGVRCRQLCSTQGRSRSDMIPDAPYGRHMHSSNCPAFMASHARMTTSACMMLLQGQGTAVWMKAKAKAKARVLCIRQCRLQHLASNPGTAGSAQRKCDAPDPCLQCGAKLTVSTKSDAEIHICVVRLKGMKAF